MSAVSTPAPVDGSIGAHNYLDRRRNALRNRTIFLLSVRAGLRAKQIACLRCNMLLDVDGVLSAEMAFQNEATKGKSGRQIPLNKELRASQSELLEQRRQLSRFQPSEHVIRTERADRASPQAIVNVFAAWYRDLDLLGCSSHNRRRTFITNAAKKITMVGGSLRDVQYLAGHSSLQTTERYIDCSETARRNVVDVI